MVCGVSCQAVDLVLTSPSNRSTMMCAGPLESDTRNQESVGRSGFFFVGSSSVSIENRLIPNKSNRADIISCIKLININIKQYLKKHYNKKTFVKHKKHFKKRCRH